MVARVHYIRLVWKGNHFFFDIFNKAKREKRRWLLEQIAIQLFLANIKFACGTKTLVEASTSVTETVRRQWRRHITLGICRVLLAQQSRRKNCPKKEYNIKKNKNWYFFFFFIAIEAKLISIPKLGTGKRNAFRREGVRRVMNTKWRRNRRRQPCFY